MAKAMTARARSCQAAGRSPSLLSDQYPVFSLPRPLRHSLVSIRPEIALLTFRVEERFQEINGQGKRTVELFSVAISVSVWR